MGMQMLSTLEQKQAKYLREKEPILWVAMRHHHTNKNKMMNFVDNPFLIDIFKDKNPYMVIMKSTQNGLTEYLIIRELYEAMHEGRNIFHVLPTRELMGRFVKNRINRTIEFTKYYKAILEKAQDENTTSRRSSDSMSLKDFGPGTIAYVGSNSPSAFAEFPADTLVIDELNHCEQTNLDMAWERLSYSEHKRQVKIANPTIEGFGIDIEFGNSDQKYWHIKHDCGEWVRPDFFSHILEHIESTTYRVRDKEWEPNNGKDINMICHKCGKPVYRKAKGEWVAKYPNFAHSGRQISKLYSSNTSITEIVERFEKGLTNDIAMQRFYNGDLGIAYTAKGAKLTRTDLDACKINYKMPFNISENETACIAGADIGSKIHVRISQLLPGGKLRAVFIGSVDEFDDIIELSERYRVVCGVVDAMPEQRLSRNLCARMPAWFMCYYREVHRDLIDIPNKMITVERTQTLDAVKEAILTKNIMLPMNASDIPEYYNQMVASTRVYDETLVYPKYVWKEGSKPDHFFHAEAYQLLAQKFITSVGR